MEVSIGWTKKKHKKKTDTVSIKVEIENATIDDTNSLIGIGDYLSDIIVRALRPELYCIGKMNHKDIRQDGTIESFKIDEA